MKSLDAIYSKIDSIIYPILDEIGVLFELLLPAIILVVTICFIYNTADIVNTHIMEKYYSLVKKYSLRYMTIQGHNETFKPLAVEKIVIYGTCRTRKQFRKTNPDYVLREYLKTHPHVLDVIDEVEYNVDLKEKYEDKLKNLPPFMEEEDLRFIGVKFNVHTFNKYEESMCRSALYSSPFNDYEARFKCIVYIKHRTLTKNESLKYTYSYNEFLEIANQVYEIFDD